MENIQTEIEEYKKRWKSHLKDFNRLKWNLSNGQTEELNRAMNTIDRLISLAGYNLQRIRQDE